MNLTLENTGLHFRAENWARAGGLGIVCQGYGLVPQGRRDRSESWGISVFRTKRRKGSSEKN